MPSCLICSGSSLSRTTERLADHQQVFSLTPCSLKPPDARCRRSCSSWSEAMFPSAQRREPARRSRRRRNQAEVSSRMRVMIAKDIDIYSLGVLLSQNRWRLRFARHCFRKCRKLLPIASKLPAMVFARLGRKQQPRRLHGWFFELNRKQL